jgi:hypothetical protein
MNHNYILGLIGTWIVSDSLYSLILYKDKGESFWKCHSIRVVRLLCGMVLIVMGSLNG